MATQKCFDKRFADVVAGLVKGLPRLTTEALLASVINTAFLEKRLTQTLCPVWNIIPETLQDQFSHPANLYCIGCMVNKEHCPAYTFDTEKIRFLTFEKAEEGPISGKQRIARLLKSRYLPLTTNMFSSLIRRWHHKMYGLVNQLSVQDGTIVLDGILMRNDLFGANVLSLVSPKEKKELLPNVQDLGMYATYVIRKTYNDTLIVFVADFLNKKETRQYSIVYDPS